MRNFFVVLMMIFVGFLVGFRIHAGVVPFAASIGLLLLFSFAFSWIFALIGLGVPNAEAAQAASFPVLALLGVRVDGVRADRRHAGWLQTYNRIQPVSVVVKAERALAIGGDTAVPVLHLLWIVALTAIFAPLAINRYRRAA